MTTIRTLALILAAAIIVPFGLVVLAFAKPKKEPKP